ncbi:MAG: hypothetical protein CFE44_24335, partial [Burkholderiales bacterium PBB4]
MDAIQEGLRAHRPTEAAVWIVRLGERWFGAGTSPHRCANKWLDDCSFGLCGDHPEWGSNAIHPAREQCAPCARYRRLTPKACQQSCDIIAVLLANRRLQARRMFPRWWNCGVRLASSGRGLGVLS